MMKRSFGRDELIVNFEDACVYGRDLALLQSPTAWLNDAIINFFFQRLASTASSSEIFFDPSVLSFLMHQCSDNDDLQDFASGYDEFKQARRIYFPINDTMRENSTAWSTPGSGTHWSLLVAVITTTGESTIIFHHFDSIQGSENLTAATAVASKWQRAFQFKRADLTADVEISSIPVPRQRNGYDCGCHVLRTAQAIYQNTDLDADRVALRNCVAKAIPNKDDDSLFLPFRREVANDILSLTN